MLIQEDHGEPVMLQVEWWNTAFTPSLGTCEALNALRSCCHSRMMILAILNLGVGSQVLARRPPCNSLSCAVLLCKL